IRDFHVTGVQTCALPICSLLAWGLRARLAEGYRAADLRADAMAGLVVGVVALPLSMALAIASGVPPQHGLYTAIIAGVTCALLEIGRASCRERWGVLGRG